MKILLKLSIILTLFMVFSGCKSEMVISHGSSFGHCRGLCNKELKLMHKKTTFSTWENGNTTVTNTLEVANQGADFDKASALLDPEAFKKLESRYGCPDCADGGAEWIEVKVGLNTKRVTFEYGNPPAELKALNDQLRKIQAQYDKANNK